ncbi:hypothetical protein FGO68_gene7096 [Halteria grandinella]|uniref:Uncharacterized protein n=1 Tax=Halteria grandinella TaxID=5974 RepID=A0A8J8NEC8_HALGN|nr:hypothetical protein FGO68_gene7096 [Halteria grandinella]
MTTILYEKHALTLYETQLRENFRNPFLFSINPLLDRSAALFMNDILALCLCPLLPDRQANGRKFKAD